MQRTLIQHIASLIVARANCARMDNLEWHAKHEESLNRLAFDFLPSGSGIDCGTKIDLEKSNAHKIVLNTSFHHMDEHGGYDGWTEHTVTVTPSFDGFDLAISGRDRDGIKDYLADTFDSALREMLDWTDKGFYRVARAA